MIEYDKPDNMSILEAMFEAQKIAFGPIVFQATKSLLDLGILELISENETTGISTEEIAERLHLPIYGVDVLVVAGVGAKIIRPLGDKWTLTKVGHILIANTLTRVNLNFVNDVCYEGMFSLKESIKEEKPVGLKVFGKWNSIYEGLSKLPENVKKSWFDFDHFYSDGVFDKTLDVILNNNPKVIMDVGANTGKFTIQCLEKSNSLSMIMVDHNEQLTMAKKNLELKGLSDRAIAHPMNIQDESNQLPQGADAILMSQFLDCFSQKEIVSILKRARAAMKTDSVLYILETFVDRQEHEAAAYSLTNISLYFTAMANGTSKMYFSNELVKLVEEAGLKVVEELEHIGPFHTLLKIVKK